MNLRFILNQQSSIENHHPSYCVISVRTAANAASNMVEVFVDGTPVEVEIGTTVLQVIWLLFSFYICMFNACQVLPNCRQKRK